jgi:hypothetical protein
MAFPVADLIAAVHLELSESSKRNIEREFRVFSKRLIGIGIGALAAKAIKELADQTFGAAIIIDQKAEVAFDKLKNAVSNVFDNIAANIAPSLTRAMQNLADAMIAAGPLIAMVAKIVNQVSLSYFAAANLFGVAIHSMMATLWDVISKIHGHQLVFPGAKAAAEYSRKEAQANWETVKDINAEIAGQKTKYISPAESEAARRKRAGGGELVTGAIENLQFELMKRAFGDPVAKAQLETQTLSLSTLRSIDGKMNRGGAQLQ